MSEYSRSVFLNCPFDSDYDGLFDTIVYTVHACGFVLRCAKEYYDTDPIRIDKIVSLIRKCKYSIHDISRVGLDGHNGLPRFNMPLELGIVMGSKSFGTGKHKRKNYLIVESERYRFKQFISDISGQDIQEHKDDPLTVVRCVRNWLSTKTSNQLPSASIMYQKYEVFRGDLPAMCAESRWVQSELTFNEYISLVVNWLATD